ncbi:uncharacterized protein TNCV_3341811 [Trichonephila clavipes]|nr:uncharacterized protein TNCV_3341811 [Trichonephila clavipes]
MRTSLNATFGVRRIERGGPIPRPFRSPDLSSLDYFLWVHLKNFVYVTPLVSDEDVAALISEAGNVCVKCLASLNVCASHSTDTVKHVLLLVNILLNNYRKH